MPIGAAKSWYTWRLGVNIAIMNYETNLAGSSGSSEALFPGLVSGLALFKEGLWDLNVLKIKLGIVRHSL